MPIVKHSLNYFSDCCSPEPPSPDYPVRVNALRAGERTMGVDNFCPRKMKLPSSSSLLVPLLAGAFLTASHPASAQASPAYTPPAQIQPTAPYGNRPTRNFDTPIGLFQGQSDIGGTQQLGDAHYDSGTKVYTITSAGYNTVFIRDEFRYLWSRMSGDVSLTADITFPDPNGYEGRKAMLVIRENLNDDSKEAVAAVYGNGAFRIGQRPKNGVRRVDMEYRVWSREGSGNPPARVSSVVMPKRLGIEKSGDTIVLLISVHGEPMHPFGEPLILHMDGPFYVGIGFCSNLPDKSDIAIFSNVVLESPLSPVRASAH